MYIYIIMTSLEITLSSLHSKKYNKSNLKTIVEMVKHENKNIIYTYRNMNAHTNILKLNIYLFFFFLRNLLTYKFKK